MAFLDSGFYPHPDLMTPLNRVVAYEDLVEQRRTSLSTGAVDSWQWHGTQTSVAAAGSGQLSNGVYRGLAHEAELVLVKVSERGRITEENIAKGIQWAIANRERYNIRVLNISLGGDQSWNRSDRRGRKLRGRGPPLYSARKLALSNYGGRLYRSQSVERKFIRFVSVKFRCDS
jgi:subtilase family protein